MFERQDSARMDYMAEREARHSFSGITQQASVESTDSRLCYLTSSEVSYILFIYFIYVLQLGVYKKYRRNTK